MVDGGWWMGREEQMKRGFPSHIHIHHPPSLCLPRNKRSSIISLIGSKSQPWRRLWTIGSRPTGRSIRAASATNLAAPTPRRPSRSRCYEELAVAPWFCSRAVDVGAAADHRLAGDCRSAGGRAEGPRRCAARRREIAAGGRRHAPAAKSPAAPKDAPTASPPGKATEDDNDLPEKAPAPSGSAGTPSETATDSTADEDKETLELLKVFVDSLDQIQRNYVKPVNRRELVEAAISGMTEKLDPYSNYISPQQVERFRSSVENQFGGIGIQVSVEDRQIKIISPLVGTPAYRAGMMAGDIIIEIDGKSIKGASLDDAVRMMKGPVGSKVTVTVFRHAGNRRETFTMTREIVHVETVLGDRRGDDDQWDFMLRSPRSGSATSASRRSAATRCASCSGADGRCRSRRCGDWCSTCDSTPAACSTRPIETCDLFIDKGRIVSTQGRNTAERRLGREAGRHVRRLSHGGAGEPL